MEGIYNNGHKVLETFKHSLSVKRTWHLVKYVIDSRYYEIYISLKIKCNLKVETNSFLKMKS